MEKLAWNFNERAPEKFDLVLKSASTIGAGIVFDGHNLGAICGKCRFLLGWTWTPKDKHEGYWSCLHGCSRKFYNRLGSQTSSLTPVSNPDLRKWVSGWIGIAEGVVKVEINE